MHTNQTALALVRERVAERAGRAGSGLRASPGRPLLPHDRARLSAGLASFTSDRQTARGPGAAPGWRKRLRGGFSRLLRGYANHWFSVPTC